MNGLSPYLASLFFLYGLPSVKNLVMLAPNNYLEHIEVNSLEIFGFWLLSFGTIIYMMLDRKEMPEKLTAKDEID